MYHVIHVHVCNRGDLSDCIYVYRHSHRRHTSDHAKVHVEMHVQYTYVLLVYTLGHIIHLHVHVRGNKYSN